MTALSGAGCFANPWVGSAGPHLAILSAGYPLLPQAAIGGGAIAVPQTAFGGYSPAIPPASAQGRFAAGRHGKRLLRSPTRDPCMCPRFKAKGCPRTWWLWAGDPAFHTAGVRARPLLARHSLGTASAALDRLDRPAQSMIRVVPATVPTHLPVVLSNTPYSLPVLRVLTLSSKRRICIPARDVGIGHASEVGRRPASSRHHRGGQAA
jgi:hypothetical protein